MDRMSRTKMEIPITLRFACRVRIHRTSGIRVARRLVCLLAVLLPGWVAVAQVPEQAAVINREYSIKAAFLYQFSHYVEWPPQALRGDQQPFVIGVLHSDPFGTALAHVAQTKTVNGHPMDVRVLKSREGVEQCQILFVPKNAPPNLQAAVLQAAHTSAVLVVGETDDFIERGGDVQFFLEGNKVRFAFSAQLAKREDLKVSSKLLALAKIVPTR
jgi:hypothetical protein